jgi:hypothetical protein
MRDAIVEALVHLPSETRFPMIARQCGVEVLARSAASRRDWAAVLHITRNPLVSRIRDRIWSWAYREWTERSEQSDWAMSIVFDWIADQADVLGDLPAAAINRENARVARIAA